MIGPNQRDAERPATIDSTPLASRSTARLSRVKTGCLCCRLRRKKCDEKRPVCTGCSRNGLLCSWPPEQNLDAGTGRAGWRSRLLSGKPTANSWNRSSKNENDRDVLEQESLKTSVPQSQYRDSLSTAPRAIPQRKSERSDHTALSIQLRPPGADIIHLHRSSPPLFEHYVRETSRYMSARIVPENPFLTCVLPVAHNNTLIMQCVLALGGAHLSYRVPSSETKSAAWTHYALALREMKHAVTKAVAGDVNLVHLLIAMLLLAHVETVAGNSKGAIYHHLRASRKLIISIFADHKDHAHEDHLCFVLETYTYLAMVANITIPMETDQRSIEFDPFLFSLNHLRQYKMSGFLLGCAHGLFELIPRVCLFGRQRLKESDPTPSSACQMYYGVLKNSISAWNPPADIEGDPGRQKQLITAARIYQKALLIFLETSLYGQNFKDPALRLTVQPIVDCTLHLVFTLSTLDHESPLFTTMLWPLMMACSCVYIQEQRDVLRVELASITDFFRMALVDRATDLLNWLWEAPDDVYGPLGLEIVMQRHDMTFCMG